MLHLPGKLYNKGQTGQPRPCLLLCHWIILDLQNVQLHLWREVYPAMRRPIHINHLCVKTLV